jgi:gamma-glutamyltranspeptidase/glutathione hydrolase
MKRLLNRALVGMGIAGVAFFAACGTPPRDLIASRWQGEPVEARGHVSDTARFEKFAVAADHPEASAAGAEMLSQGGNAVDAAVATSFALSVVRPESCGIGGGGFMVVHLAGGPTRNGQPPRAVPMNVVIDYRERAPASASPDMFEKLGPEASQWSGRAVAVPGTVAGLLDALERYGTLSREQVLAPAIRLARNGYVYDIHAWRAGQTFAEFLAKNPGRPGADQTHDWRPFVGPISEEAIGPVCDGFRVPQQEPRPKPPREFTRRVNLAQAATLERIAKHGADGFYQGETANAIVAAVNRHGGGLTLEDLAAVRTREGKPLEAVWRGRTIVTMPLPSSGGVTLLQILALMERTRPQWAAAVEGFQQRLAAFEDHQKGDPLPPPPVGPEYAHALAESFKHAFADRAQYLGDPAFMPADPTPRLLDPVRLDAKAAMIDPAKTLPDDAYAKGGLLPDLLSSTANPPDDHGTSHLSAVDQWGNAVACTETINLTFGSRILVPECGFFLNNQMDDFQTRRGEANAFGLVQSDRNLPEPGKCPLSSMTPTIVLGADGKVESVLGASGGPRIITGVAQSLLFAHDLGCGAAAVGLPRVHHQWKPATLLIEPTLNPIAHAWSGSFGGSLLDPDEIAKDGESAFDEDKIMKPIVDAMKARGHEVAVMFEGAAVQMIHRDSAGGWQAASDPRKGGAPAGE